jgi:hypothetical protein
MLARLLVIALGSALVAVLPGCAKDAIDVSTTFDPLSRFPAQATYVWDTAASKLPDDPRFNQMDTDALIQEAANAEFAARGYRVAAGGTAPHQYRLSYDLTVHTWYGPDNSSSLGSLSLWLSDAATRRRVWMGYVRAEIHVGLSREERLDRLRKAMASMLEKFPPAQRGE